MAKREPKITPEEAGPPEPPVLLSTDDYEMIVEVRVVNGTVDNLDCQYAVRHKETGVLELRYYVYGEAIQGLMQAQALLDKFMAVYLVDYKKAH